jgi:hypothetical protein
MQWHGIIAALHRFHVIQLDGMTNRNLALAKEFALRNNWLVSLQHAKLPRRSGGCMPEIKQKPKYYNLAMKFMFACLSALFMSILIYVLNGPIDGNFDQTDFELSKITLYFGLIFAIAISFMNHEIDEYYLYFVKILFIALFICAISYLYYSKVGDSASFRTPFGFSMSFLSIRLSVVFFSLCLIYVFFFAFYSYFRPIEHFVPLDYIEKKDAYVDFPLNRVAQLKELNRRSMAFDKFGTIILLVIVIFIATSVFLILYAGKIVSTDTSSTNFVQVIQSRISNLELTRSSNEQYIIELSREISDLKLKEASKKISELDDVKKVKEATIESMTVELDLRSFQSRSLSAQNRRTKIATELAAASTALNDLVRRGTPGIEGSNNSMQILFVSAMTRIGILVMTIYLVRFFVQIYTYNARLNAFYRSRHDAILVSDHDPKKLGELGKLFLAPYELKSPNFAQSDPILKSVGGIIDSAKGLASGVSSQKTQ